ncbi:hypothetical protein HK104_008415 [Borealophlyctis nickersoniae]|nr:hypothetical protein HK104_008415 [Borealophlyctis nickersoniae]
MSIGGPSRPSKPSRAALLPSNSQAQTEWTAPASPKTPQKRNIGQYPGHTTSSSKSDKGKGKVQFPESPDPAPPASTPLAKKLTAAGPSNGGGASSSRTPLVLFRSSSDGIRNIPRRMSADAIAEKLDAYADFPDDIIETASDMVTYNESNDVLMAYIIAQQLTNARVLKSIQTDMGDRVSITPQLRKVIREISIIYLTNPMVGNTALVIEWVMNTLRDHAFITRQQAKSTPVWQVLKTVISSIWSNARSELKTDVFRKQWGKFHINFFAMKVLRKVSKFPFDHKREAAVLLRYARDIAVGEYKKRGLPLPKVDDIPYWPEVERIRLSLMTGMTQSQRDSLTTALLEKDEAEYTYIPRDGGITKASIVLPTPDIRKISKTVPTGEGTTKGQMDTTRKMQYELPPLTFQEEMDRMRGLEELHAMHYEPDDRSDEANNNTQSDEEEENRYNPRGRGANSRHRANNLPLSEEENDEDIISPRGRGANTSGKQPAADDDDIISPSGRRAKLRHRASNPQLSSEEEEDIVSPRGRSAKLRCRTTSQVSALEDENARDHTHGGSTRKHCRLPAGWRKPNQGQEDEIDRRHCDQEEVESHILIDSSLDEPNETGQNVEEEDDHTMRDEDIPHKKTQLVQSFNPEPTARMETD